MDLLHVFIGDGSGKVRVRHGEGEAWREFTEAEYTGYEFKLWIASVHRYEVAQQQLSVRDD